MHREDLKCGPCLKCQKKSEDMMSSWLEDNSRLRINPIVKTVAPHARFEITLSIVTLTIAPTKVMKTMKLTKYADCPPVETDRL